MSDFQDLSKVFFFTVTIMKNQYNVPFFIWFRLFTKL